MFQKPCCKSCDDAAEKGHLYCLKALHEHGCSWDIKICWTASYFGHLECLRYAREHGCPWDDWTCKWAARNGYLDCLGYAWARGCPCPPEAMEQLQHTTEWRAANRIADAWAYAYWCPRRKVGKDRLDRDYEKLKSGA